MTVTAMDDDRKMQAGKMSLDNVKFNKCQNVSLTTRFQEDNQNPMII